MSALAAANEPGVNGVALAVLIFFFVIVAMAGFWAARWRRPTSARPSSADPPPGSTRNITICDAVDKTPRRRPHIPPQRE